jgi:hypothetical protein
MEIDSRQIQLAAAILGRKGGRSRSEKKAQSSRLNGLKGGRNHSLWSLWWVCGEEASLVPLRPGEGKIVKARNMMEAIKKGGKHESKGNQ